MARANSTGLRRDLELLEVLASPEARRRDGLGVVRVAALAGRETTQVSRALATLCDAGLVDRDEETRAYRLGWRLYTLAAQTLEAHLDAVAKPFLLQVCDQVQETTHLCVLRGLDVVTVATQSQPHAFRVMWEGIPVAAPSTSAGRVLISEWPTEQVREIFTSERLSAGEGRCALTTTEQLLDELAAIRSRGYATVDEEFDVGLVGCSAPVRDARGRIVAAINIGAPKARLGSRLDAAGMLTAHYAGKMSEVLAQDG
ncbi:IclR family transcriptional regulator [Nocardioides mesophilus]|uniref:IclR family transcriptional regulator n=1 Tax=Nocardioides mesophilus TaxID=433659 RepID=A0A7G9R9U2_9ACTN|nr:IclR family transcriptional regulator [Nocardioides mesophilus]QNN52367.1 IclR family transcriptional regulator [Nocardioides mesophilus]